MGMKKKLLVIIEMYEDFEWNRMNEDLSHHYGMEFHVLISSEINMEKMSYPKQGLPMILRKLILRSWTNILSP